MSDTAMLVPPHVRQWISSEGSESSLLITGVSDAALRLAFEALLEEAVEGGRTIRADTVIVDETTKTLSIKEVRGLVSATTRTALKSYRLLLIAGAERLSIPAANALLKTLEEAPRSSRFVLMTRWPGRLLPTMLSRCQVWRLGTRGAAASSYDVDAWWEHSLLQRFRDVTSLDDEALAQLEFALSEQLRTEGVSEGLRLAFMRLRDYYRISKLSGNEKLAREVLLAALPNPTGLSHSAPQARIVAAPEIR